MKLIKWQKNFAIGVASIDYEHQQMIEKINEALARIYESRKSDEITRLLGDIHAGISSHFALEEKLMRDAAYEEFDEHKDDHELLLDEIREIMDRFEGSAGKTVESRLSGRLIGWFSTHFSTFDAKLHKLLG